MLALDGRREVNMMIVACRSGFDAKERGRIIRVYIGGDGQLWTWRSAEDVAAGRALEVGQETLAVSGSDAVDYCTGMGLKNDETTQMIQMLRCFKQRVVY